ncbi:MAG: hypothetical protein SFY66_17830 [Oculatellaceae cyanobacterium bins.114]|nr:hypothetical protein [Oculatellaceae cyanobacterium bins.114]
MAQNKNGGMKLPPFNNYSITGQTSTRYIHPIEASTLEGMILRERCATQHIFSLVGLKPARFKNKLADP